MSPPWSSGASTVFGKRFDFAGDELSGEEQAKILSQAIGRPINYQEIPIAAARQQSEDVALMFEWFDSVGYDVDIAALQQGFSGGPLAQFRRLGARV